MQQSTMGDEAAIVVNNLIGATEFVVRRGVAHRAGIEVILDSGASVVHGEVGLQEAIDLVALHSGELLAERA